MNTPKKKHGIPLRLLSLYCFYLFMPNEKKPWNSFSKNCTNHYGICSFLPEKVDFQFISYFFFFLPKSKGKFLFFSSDKAQNTLIGACQPNNILTQWEWLNVYYSRGITYSLAFSKGLLLLWQSWWMICQKSSTYTRHGIINLWKSNYMYYIKFKLLFSAGRQVSGAAAVG